PARRGGVCTAAEGAVRLGRGVPARVLEDPREKPARVLDHRQRSLAPRCGPSGPEEVHRRRAAVTSGLRGLTQARGQGPVGGPSRTPDRGGGAAGTALRRLGQDGRGQRVAQEVGRGEGGRKAAATVVRQRWGATVGGALLSPLPSGERG